MNLKSICGVVIAAKNPEALASFYSQVFNTPFAQEDHGNLAIHFGLDIGEVHLGIHPPSNLGMDEVGNSSISVAYNVASLSSTIAKLVELNAQEVIPVHDEGFGNVATYKDPEGNNFEVVELSYDFGSA